jgi:pentatricopeptide repeat protein
VLTEAMAEVYAKQGQADKALEIYRKLSLLDPSRSATFAAKIAELNNPDR